MRSLAVLLLMAPAVPGADSVVSGMPDPPPVLAAVGRVEDRLIRLEAKVDQLLTGGRPAVAPIPIGIVAPGVQRNPFPGSGPVFGVIATPAPSVDRPPLTVPAGSTTIINTSVAAGTQSITAPVPRGSEVIHRLNPPGGSFVGCSGSG